MKIQPFYSQKWCKIGDKCHWNWFLMLEVSKILEIKIVLLFQFQDKVIYRKCCTLKPFKTIWLIKITVLGSWRMKLNNVTSSSSAVPFHGCPPERRDQAARMETVDCHRPVTPVLSRGGLIKRSTISTNQDMASSRLVGNRWPFVEWMSKLKVKVRKLVFIIIMIRIVNKEKPARKTIVIVRIVKDKIYSQLGSNKKIW